MTVRVLWFFLGALVVASMDYGDLWVNVCFGACEGNIRLETKR